MLQLQQMRTRVGEILYDEARDAFIPPKPFPSWTLNEQTCLWDAPVPYPQDGKTYTWSEDDQLWLEVQDA